MKITIAGGTGQLGQDVRDVYMGLGHDVVSLTHDDLDVTDSAAVENVIAQIKPDVMINAAAMHNVEACEGDILGAFHVNTLGARNLALAATAYDFAILHVSTDYVFDGEKRVPYVETDAPNPLNVYANTKLSGEHFVRTLAPRHFVVRVSGLFGTHPCRAKGGRNFVTTMLKLAAERDEVRVVDDEYLSPSHTLDVARQIAKLTETEKYGLYHVASQGQCSWHTFAQKIFELTKVDIKLSIASSDEFPSKVNRPRYSVLDNKRLRDDGLDIMPTWEDGLSEYIELSR